MAGAVSARSTFSGICQRHRLGAQSNLVGRPGKPSSVSIITAPLAAREPQRPCSAWSACSSSSHRPPTSEGGRRGWLANARNGTRHRLRSRQPALRQGVPDHHALPGCLHVVASAPKVLISGSKVLPMAEIIRHRPPSSVILIGTLCSRAHLLTTAAGVDARRRPPRQFHAAARRPDGHHQLRLPWHRCPAALIELGMTIRLAREKNYRPPICKERWRRYGLIQQGRQVSFRLNRRMLRYVSPIPGRVFH